MGAACERLDLAVRSPIRRRSQIDPFQPVVLCRSRPSQTSLNGRKRPGTWRARLARGSSSLRSSPSVATRHLSLSRIAFCALDFLSSGRQRAANGLLDFTAPALRPRILECGAAERLPHRRELSPSALLVTRWPHHPQSFAGNRGGRI